MNTQPNTVNKGKLFVTVFAFLPAGRQVFLLPRQIRNVYTATAPEAIYTIRYRDYFAVT
jgi:hypothetical protein